MPKKTRSFTIDESVYNQMQARNDTNFSAVVNNFLKRYLRGEETDKAAKRMQVERLKDDAQEKQNEAQNLMQQAQELESELEEEREEREESWEKAVQELQPELHNQLSSVPDDPMPEYKPSPDAKRVEFYADKIGISPHELVERFPEKRQQYGNLDDVDSGSRGFQ